MVEEVKIHHNKFLFVVIFILLILFGVLVGVSYGFNKNYYGAECSTDIDCVPAGCCHPSSCVAAGNEQDCSAVLCTQECQPGTLDCGQGSCICIDGKCGAVIDNEFSKEQIY